MQDSGYLIITNGSDSVLSAYTINPQKTKWLTSKNAIDGDSE